MPHMRGFYFVYDIILTSTISF